jgi:hypothetical protein
MKYTMIVTLVGGEMKTKHICPTISIVIRGRLFVEPHHYRLQGHRYNSWHGLVEEVQWNDSVHQESHPFNPRRWHHCETHGSIFCQLD